MKMKKALLKLLKISLTVILSLVTAIIIHLNLFKFLYKYPRVDEEITSKFEEYRASFDFLNEYIRETYELSPDTEHILIGIFRNNDKVKLYDDSYIELPERVDRALNAIYGDNYSTETCIFITKNHIIYHGFGFREYVYSINGKAPKYYYPIIDRNHLFRTYKLSDNWYELWLLAR